MTTNPKNLTEIDADDNVQIGLRIPAGDLAEIRALADAERTSVSQWIRLACVTRLKAFGRQAAAPGRPAA